MQEQNPRVIKGEPLLGRACSFDPNIETMLEFSLFTEKRRHHRNQQTIYSDFLVYQICKDAKFVEAEFLWRIKGSCRQKTKMSTLIHNKNLL